MIKTFNCNGILFLGDFFYDYEDLKEDYLKICNYVEENNYKVILNLESSLFLTDTPIPKNGPNLACSTKAIEALKELNVVAVCMANNHTMDYGYKGLKQTFAMLDRADIMHVGAGSNLIEAIEPIVFEINNQLVFILNYGWNIEETVYASDKEPGCAPRVNQLIISKTKELKNKYPTAKIVNVLHWGFEYNTLPMPYDINLAHKLIDIGCDLVIGHHPHVIQPYEIYKNKEIYYSIGNFYFGSLRNFNKIFKNEITEKMCNFGLGVITNFIDTKTIVIGFDEKNNESFVDKSNYMFPIYLDIKFPYSGKNYIQQAKNHRNNINPILGLNNNKNKLLLKFLSIKHCIGRCLRFLKRSQIGNKVYGFIKDFAS